MGIDIREYKESDKKALLKIIDNFQDYMISIDPLKAFRRMAGFAENYLNNMRDDISKNQGMIYLSFDDEKLVGYVTGIIKKQTEDDLLGYIPVLIGEVTELYIEQEYRGQQIGTNLLNKIESYFKTKGCNRSWLSVYKANTGALDFYRSNGYDEATIYLMKQLD